MWEYEITGINCNVGEIQVVYQIRTGTGASFDRAHSFPVTETTTLNQLKQEANAFIQAEIDELKKAYTFQGTLLTDLIGRVVPEQ